MLVCHYQVHQGDRRLAWGPHSLFINIFDMRNELISPSAKMKFLSSQTGTVKKFSLIKKFGHVFKITMFSQMSMVGNKTVVEQHKVGNGHPYTIIYAIEIGRRTITNFKVFNISTKSYSKSWWWKIGDKAISMKIYFAGLHMWSSERLNRILIFFIYGYPIIGFPLYLTPKWYSGRPKKLYSHNSIDLVLIICCSYEMSRCINLCPLVIICAYIHILYVH